MSMTLSLEARGGQTVYVSDEDGAYLGAFTWVIDSNGYPIRWEKGKRFSLHREIMGRPTNGLHVDHINGNVLDARRSNLRLVTRFENEQNRRGAPKSSTTGVRGVYYAPHRCGKSGRYRAQLTAFGKRYRIGRFKTLEEAAQAVAEARALLMTHSKECGKVTPSPEIVARVARLQGK